MRILLQEPFMGKEKIFGNFSGSGVSNTFPYGLACIASYVMARGFSHVRYLEPSISKVSLPTYYNIIRHYDVVGIGSTTLEVGHALNTFRLAKKANPRIVTVLGGVHGTIMPKEVLEDCTYLDFVVIGEGERPFLELLNFLKHRRPNLFQISGLAYREKGRIRINPPGKLLEPNEFPIPAYEFFPMKKYVPQITLAKSFPTYSLLASRGCRYHCAFCCANAVLGSRVRYKNVDSLIEEMLLLKNRFGAKGIMFHDSTFTADGDWVMAFCKELLRRRVRLAWSCNSRTDTVSLSMLKLMKQAGCWEICFGIESGNQKSLDRLRKGTTVAQNTRAVKMAKEADLYVFACYILGIPGETERDALRTIEYAKKLATPLAMFYLPIPYPKTKLWEECKRDGGLRKGATWEDYHCWETRNPVYVNPLIGKSRMQELIRRAYFEYYSQPRVVLSNLKEILLLRQNPRRYFLGIMALKWVF